MSKPLWWKNSVKLIKQFTTEDSQMTFDWEEDYVYFLYSVQVEGVSVRLEETISKDALSAPDTVQKQSSQQ